MTKTFKKILIATALLFTLPASAATIKFEVADLIGSFSGSPLSGSFLLDTDSQLLSNVSLRSQAGAFTSGLAIDNASGFGLRDTSFLFSGAAELLFEIADFSRLMPGLAIGESVNIDVFVSQAANFDDNFSNPDPFDASSDVFPGTGTAMRLAEVSIPVPVPAGLSLLAVCFGGLILFRRRV